MMYVHASMDERQCSCLPLCLMGTAILAFQSIAFCNSRADKQKLCAKLYASRNGQKVATITTVSLSCARILARTNFHTKAPATRIHLHHNDAFATCMRV